LARSPCAPSWHKAASRCACRRSPKDPLTVGVITGGRSWHSRES
jgi:hypothetical protein